MAGAKSIIITRMYKKLVIGLAVVVLVVLVYAGYLLTGRAPGGSPSGTQSSSTPGVQSAENIAVPEASSTNVPAGVAIPQTVLPSALGAVSDLRIFSVDIKNGSFTPNTLVVRQGDSIQVRFSAEDKNYDVFQPQYGFSLKVSKGTTKVLGFDAVQAGKFQYYCKSCGGPSAGPVGYINVVPN